MLPASSKGGGQCVASAPDVCKTPSPAGPVPVPYPNLASVSSASGTCSKVLFKKKQAVTIKSTIPSSKGDEPGTVGGVISNCNRGKMVYKKASSKVFAKGKKVSHITSLTAHNGSNANVPVGAQVAPSQTKVLVAL
jgi:hypothetical protein